MNRPMNEEDGRRDRLLEAFARFERRCAELGLGCAHLESCREPSDLPMALQGLGIAALLNAEADTPVRLDGETAAAVFPLRHRTEDLGTMLVYCRQSDADGEDPAGRLRSVAPMLRWSLNDALETVELHGDIEDLADQMSDAYETLELMYTLGRSMAGLDHPDRFIDQTCARVRETLGFGYVAVHIPEDADVGSTLAGRTITDGEAGLDSDESRLSRLMAIMISASTRAEAFNGPQAVVRPLRNDAGVVGMIIAGDKQREAGNVSSYDTKLIDAVGGLLSTFLTNARLYDEQREMVMGVLESLSAAIDAKDPYTRGHAQRVAHLSEQIALKLGYSDAEAERLRISGLLHDVGKIGISEAVLCKSGRLTDAEYDEIKRHPEIGHRILKDLKGLRDILPAVLHHHERIDGRGYPVGLAGDQIPMIARIVAAADTFDAMSSTRSYRAKMPRETVLEEIRKSAGTQLDPGVAEALLSIDLSEFDRMIEEHARLSSFEPKAA